MQNKTMYRIYLMPHSNGLAETLAVMAAKTNGDDKSFTLANLKTIADGQIMTYPSLNENTTCELIGESVLHLDRKVGEQYETVLRIEKVEILDVPTLSYQTGIANPEFMECIN